MFLYSHRQFLCFLTPKNCNFPIFIRNKLKFVLEIDFGALISIFTQKVEKPQVFMKSYSLPWVTYSLDRWSQWQQGKLYTLKYRLCNET